MDSNYQWVLNIVTKRCLNLYIEGHVLNRVQFQTLKFTFLFHLIDFPQNSIRQLIRTIHSLFIVIDTKLFHFINRVQMMQDRLSISDRLQNQNQSQSQSQIQNNSSQSVSYFTYSRQQASIKFDFVQQSSHQVASSSHEVFDSQENGNKKKKKKIKISNKNRIKTKSKSQNKKTSQDQLTVKKEADLKKKTSTLETTFEKSQQKLNKFLSSISEDEQQEKKVSVIATYQLDPRQAKYLNKFQLQKGYSLHKVDQHRNDRPFKSKIALKQRTLNRYLSAPQKVSNLNQSLNLTIQQQKQRRYSASYYIMKSVLRELIENDSVHYFFKQSIDEVMCYEGTKRYYFEYKSIIKEPLDLKMIEHMIQTGHIKNLIQFEAVFNQLIQNSIVIHTHLQNNYMLQCTQQLNKIYRQLLIKNTCPQMEDLEKSSIKTKAFQQKPKSKKILIEGEINKQVEYMDLTDLINKNRIKVMNNFLHLICEKNQTTLYTFISKMKSMIMRYVNDKVQIVRKQPIQNQTTKDKKQPQRPYLNNALKSPKSSRSQNTSNNELSVYEIIPLQMSTSLFQQLKALIKCELRENRRAINHGLEESQIIRNILYPHEDSEDFDLGDDSFDC